MDCTSKPLLEMLTPVSDNFELEFTLSPSYVGLISSKFTFWSDSVGDFGASDASGDVTFSQ
jgi:hypothetical protein